MANSQSLHMFETGLILEGFELFEADFFDFFISFWNIQTILFMTCSFPYQSSSEYHGLFHYSIELFGSFLACFEFTSKEIHFNQQNLYPEFLSPLSNPNLLTGSQLPCMILRQKMFLDSSNSLSCFWIIFLLHNLTTGEGIRLKVIFMLKCLLDECMNRHGSIFQCFFDLFLSISLSFLV